MVTPRIGFIGTGTVGSTLARLWHNKGYTIASVYNRTLSKATLLAKQVDVSVGKSPADIVRVSDLIFLTVPDGAIVDTVASIVNVDWRGRAVVHVSGSISIEPLLAIKEQGGMVGSLHPVFPFANSETALKHLDGITFAMEADDDTLKTWLIELVQTIHGHVIPIPYGKKAQYHAALVIASNYMVTLYSVAQQLLLEIADDSPAINQALNILMSATMANLIEVGVPSALTGPLVRTDVGTIQSHLEALAEHPQVKEAYINLAKLSYPMLRTRVIDIDLIEKTLRQENPHATDNS